MPIKLIQKFVRFVKLVFTTDFCTKIAFLKLDALALAYCFEYVWNLSNHRKHKQKSNTRDNRAINNAQRRYEEASYNA